MPVHDPPHWDFFDSLAKSHGAAHFGFVGKTGDVNRFAARYRAARSLMSIELQGFSDSIQAGYTSLVRLLLTWSAFEYLLLSIGVPKKSASSLLSPEEHQAIISELRSFGGHGSLFNAVKVCVERRYRSEIEKFLGGQPCDALMLAAAIRHAFAHGHLAPSAGGTDADVTNKVCVVLSKYLFRLMDTEFSRRIESGGGALVASGGTLGVLGASN